ncbi:Inositol-1-monophosphatase [compost metagenome]
MINVNHEEIQELFTRIGGLLLDNYSQRQAPADREEMFVRFMEANNWAEQAIKSALAERYPSVKSSDAELDLDKQKSPEFSGAYWVLDAVDGGVHLHQGFAFWSMSLCLIEDGEAVYGLVYDPYRKECFHAVRGGGAFLNGKSISAARKSRVYDSFLATAPPLVIEEDPVNTELTAWGISRLIPEAFAVRMLGSVALQLAYVACGRIDAYWEFGEQYYDWMAGALIVQEAHGGEVTDIHGRAFTWGCSGIIAANEPLREEMQAHLKR